jgi:hypothetical protein
MDSHRQEKKFTGNLFERRNKKEILTFEIFDTESEALLIKTQKLPGQHLCGRCESRDKQAI